MLKDSCASGYSPEASCCEHGIGSLEFRKGQRIHKTAECLLAPEVGLYPLELFCLLS
jgi:hypothetical protein